MATSGDIIGEAKPNLNIVTGATHVYQVPLEKLSKADPANVQEIAASQIELLSNYHQEVLGQAKNSFRWALIAAGVGLIFFLIAIAFVIYQQSLEVATIGVISGALIEFISAINFYLYGKTASQMAEFQERLDRTQRFLIANSLCESLEGEIKHKARSELIKIIAGIAISTSVSEVNETQAIASKE